MSGAHCPNFPACTHFSDAPRLPTCEKDDCPGKPKIPRDFLFHARRNEELCEGDQKHDWQGWREIDGGRGGERVCSRCGMGAMEHSLRYGP